MLIAWLSLGRAGAGEPCSDPLFLQYQARINERASAEQRLEGWRDFLKNHPQNPCAQEVQRIMDELESSSARHQEIEKREAWERESRGGLLAPGSETFPSYLILSDPVPRYRARLTSELLILADQTQFKGEVDQTILTQLLRIEASPVYNLSLTVDLPLVAGSPQGEDFGYGIGNIVLGVRGVYGRFLSGDRVPWVISGGVGWGSGSSNWSAADRDKVLNAAAYAAPYFYHFYRYHQTDYVIHLESQLGVGRHYFAAGITYHILSHEEPLTFKVPPDPVIRMFRYDLAWQMEVLPWLFPLVELNGGMSDPMSSEATHLFVSPGIQFRLENFSAALAVRIPFLDVSDYCNLVVSLEVGAQL